MLKYFFKYLGSARLLEESQLITELKGDNVTLRKAKEMELQQKGAAEPDEAFQAKMPEMMLRMLALDASQLKLALAGMRDDPSVSEETRRNLIGYSLLILSEDDRGIIHTLGVAGLCDGQAFPRLTHRVDEISMVRRDFDLLAGGGKHHLALAGVAEK